MLWYLSNELKPKVQHNMALFHSSSLFLLRVLKRSAHIMPSAGEPVFSVPQNDSVHSE